MSQQQRDIIDYLQEENRVRQQLGGQRLRLGDDQHRRLAVKAKKLARGVLREVATIVTPETLLGVAPERVILFGEASLRKAVSELVAHYHLEPNHQGLGIRLFMVPETEVSNQGSIRRRRRLGGMLNYYYRGAA
jgi:hypothetical protein